MPIHEPSVPITAAIERLEKALVRAHRTIVILTIAIVVLTAVLAALGIGILRPLR